MIAKLGKKIRQTLQSLVKFFTNTSFNVNDWKWVKDKNQQVKMVAGQDGASPEYMDIYNYYPLNYYMNINSSKSSKGKQDIWNTSKLVRLSNSVGNAFSVNSKD